MSADLDERRPFAGKSREEILSEVAALTRATREAHEREEKSAAVEEAKKRRARGQHEIAATLEEPEHERARFTEYEKNPALDAFARRERELQLHRLAERGDKHRKQVDAGRVDLVPFPKAPTLPFRVSLPLDSLPLFVVNSFEEEQRTLTLTFKVGDETIEQEFSVGVRPGRGRKKRGRGVLKQAHQEVFYRLLAKWGELGYPVTADSRGVVEMSAHALVKLLFRDDAEHRYERTEELVTDLASIPVSLKNLNTKNGLVSVEKFTLIHIDQWSERSVDSRSHVPRAGGRSLVRILFSKVVSDGFLDADVKAILLGVYESLGKNDGSGRHAEIARLLYPILDHELASKNSYHCKLATLAERLGMKKQTYKSKRVRSFAHAVRFLDGKPILGDRYGLRVELRLSADGSDYVLRAFRGPWQPFLPGLAANAAPATNGATSEADDAGDAPAVELVDVASVVDDSAARFALLELDDGEKPAPRRRRPRIERGARPRTIP